MATASVAARVRSSRPIQLFTLVVPSVFALALSFLFIGPAPARVAEGVLLWGGLGLILWRFVTRSCQPTTDGLMVRGFWRTYTVHWNELLGIQTSQFEPQYMWFFGARVFVIFTDPGGRRRAVAVSSNRKNETAKSAASAIREWMPTQIAERVPFAEDFWTPSETAWEWLPVSRKGHRPAG